MFRYPKRLLPLDLASIEPCDRYVEAIISPTESEIERNIGKSLDNKWFKKYGDTTKSIDNAEDRSKPTVIEKPEIVAPERPLPKVVKASSLAVKGKKQSLVHRPARVVKKESKLEMILERSTKDNQRWNSQKTQKAVCGGARMSAPPGVVHDDTMSAGGVILAYDDFYCHKQVTAVSQVIDDSAAQHAFEMAELAQKKLLTTEHNEQVVVIPKSASSKRESVRSKKSEVTKSPPLIMVLPTEADLAGQILESMFQKKFEKEEPKYETPTVEEERVSRRSTMLGDQTSLIEVDTVAATSAAQSADISKAASSVDTRIPKPIIEGLKATEASSIEEIESDTVEVVLAVTQTKTFKIVQSKKTTQAVIIPWKTARDTPSSTIGKTVMTTFVRSKPEKKSVTVASPKETVTDAFPKETLGVVTPKRTVKIASPKETAAVASPKETVAVASPKETAAVVTPKRAVNVTYSKDVAVVSPKRTDIVVSPTESPDTVEGTNKKGKQIKVIASKKRKEMTDIHFPGETEDTLDLIKIMEATKQKTAPVTAETSSESEYIEHSHPKSKKFEDLTKGIIHVSSSNRQILTVIRRKRTGSDEDIEDTVEEIESAESLPEDQLDIKQETRVSDTSRTKIPDQFDKSDTGSEPVLSESPETSTSTSSSEYGEPEDILFYEDSRDLPTVHTRVYTKQPNVHTKLPPIKSPSGRGARTRSPFAQNKTTIFKRKMSVTLEQLLKERRRIAPQTIVQDVREDDLEQALVLTSTGMKADTGFKIQRDHIMHEAPDSSSKCLKASATDPKQTVNNYLYSKGINQFFQYLTTRLIIDRPEKPLDYLIDIVRNVREKRELFYRMYREYGGDNEEHVHSSTCTLK